MGYTAIVDYGVGNLKSVANAMSWLGFDTVITGDAGELERAEAVILPGVGAFPDAAERLRKNNLDSKIALQILKKPVLGICLGMQLLFETGQEVRPCVGLGLIPGTVERIETSRKLPHIGWNSLTFSNDCPIFRGLEDGTYVYFVHSFCGKAAREEDVAARTDYGASVVAAVHRGNVYGCQFHPEKSGEAGLQILKNFGELSR
ncbi:MAG: imidazole glycerol phosphate synthase subunit HisH [Pseudoflavonifractor sp.]|nr:imidazole glycerol phosphate synthase subunit HisH [Pseudoflavonifractor sp.]MDY3018973.1 imidazole glycerol phosphate synthase subunit HisH [Oscillospiraceae bacterium]